MPNIEGQVVLTILKKIAAITLLVGLAGCGGAPAADSPTNLPADLTPVMRVQPTIGVQPTDETGEKLVARVNGEPITQAEYDRALARSQQTVDAASPEALGNDVLNQLIEERVILQGAAAQNITVSDEEVKAELDSQIAAAGGEANWNEWLTMNNYTAEEFPYALKVVLTNNRVRDMLTSDLEGNVRQVRARHILMRTEADAKSILDRLSAGEDFTALAAQYSQDETTRSRGGDLDWFTADELLTPQLAQTAFSLQVGQIAGPIATELGYHVIQVIEFGDLPVNADRRVTIAQNRFDSWLQPLMYTAVIERYT